MTKSSLYTMLMVWVLLCLPMSLFAQTAKKTAPIMPSGVSTAYANGASHDFTNLSELYAIKDNVQTISIQYKGLTEIPKEIAQFKNLEVFDLSHNNLRSISPSYFSKFKKLKRIYLNNNPIPKEELKRLQDQYPGVKVYYLQEHFH